MSEHVPEPWECSNRNWRGEPEPFDWYVIGDRHEIVDEDDDGNPVERGESCTSVCVVPGNATAGDITRDTAQRIAAAVNACRGIPTESLTDGAVVRLVEAAKVIVDCAHWHPGVGHYVFSPNCGPVAAWREEGMIERLKASLAELRKEAANG